ncbi:MAG: group II intron maturase-specific domain-containing protein [Candidatus Jettenia sp. CY-1]|nr:MAG: group II intron maturase-specific domain-containing protein [Candidatus Jettenia sp. CY-1]
MAYCRDYRRKGKHEVVKFEFLGFSYQPRARKGTRDGKSFTAFAAGISQTNQKRIREVIREVKLWSNTQVEIQEIAKLLNAKLRGWIVYYGKYSIRSLRNTLMMIEG